nr:hypothetical protein [Tanacetum cinerariifolium]
SAVTELVPLIEAHNHLNTISILKYDGSWRIDYCVVVLVFESRSIPLRFGEVELSLEESSCLWVVGGSGDLEDSIGRGGGGGTCEDPEAPGDPEAQDGPASGEGGWTLSSIQHLMKDLSFGDLFFNAKPSKADNEKTTAETKAKSMVFVSIQQDTSLIPPMTTPVIDLSSRPKSPNVHQPLKATTTDTTTTTIHLPPSQPPQSTTDSMLMKRIHIMANLIQVNKNLEERLDNHEAHLYTLENLDIPQQVSKAMDEIVTDAVDWAIQALLWNRFRGLPVADMKEILHQRMWETNCYKTKEDHTMLYKALEKSMNRDHSEELLKDLSEARKKKKKRRDSPKTPPRSPPYQPHPPSKLLKDSCRS